MGDARTITEWCADCCWGPLADSRTVKEALEGNLVGVRVV
jgi:hypothetical protein